MIEGSARGNTNPGIDALSVEEIEAWAPHIREVLEKMGVGVNGNENSSIAYLCEESGVDPNDIFAALSEQNNQKDYKNIIVKKIRIVSGKDKTGGVESVKELVIKQGEVVAFVGPTGSGKSRLLSDVESL
nr:hypothetical protein [Candidatus Kapabacteria bacterium]